MEQNLEKQTEQRVSLGTRAKNDPLGAFNVKKRHPCFVHVFARGLEFRQNFVKKTLLAERCFKKLTSTKLPIK